MKKIGIMGGTFDPIHVGHLMIAEAVWDEFKLDKVIFIPSANPPHKHSVMTSAKHRFNMTYLQLAPILILKYLLLRWNVLVHHIP